MLGYLFLTISKNSSLETGMVTSRKKNFSLCSFAPCAAGISPCSLRGDSKFSVMIQWYHIFCNVSVNISRPGVLVESYMKLASPFSANA